VTKKADVENLLSVVEKDYGGRLDVLINNAGFAYKGDVFGADEAEVTFNINYYGVKNMCEAFLPILSKSPVGGRCVNVCSEAGHLKIVSPELQQQFASSSLTVAQLDDLMKKFVSDVRAGDYKQKGWPQSMYGTSKLGAVALTKVYARTVPSVLSLACCPGYVKTDMSSQKGHLTIEEGADTPCWLATSDAVTRDFSGGFFSGRKPLTW